jgi:hypothetical protein
VTSNESRFADIISSILAITGIASNQENGNPTPLQALGGFTE